MVLSDTISLTTRGFADIQDITSPVTALVQKSQISGGTVTVFCPGSNGFSHVRAALLGPSLTVPITGGKLTLGTWQQIVFIDFDNRSRRRKIVVQVMGE
jgi:thiamine phosphate synthase YjbQ (UPF0047 family)